MLIYIWVWSWTLHRRRPSKLVAGLWSVVAISIDISHSVPVAVDGYMFCMAHGELILMAFVKARDSDQVLLRLRNLQGKVIMVVSLLNDARTQKKNRTRSRRKRITTFVLLFRAVMKSCFWRGDFPTNRNFSSLCCDNNCLQWTHLV